MLWHDPPNHATTYSSIIQNATPLEQVIMPSLMDENQQIQKAVLNRMDEPSNHDWIARGEFFVRMDV
jgi:hypothetical protein